MLIAVYQYHAENKFQTNPSKIYETNQYSSEEESDFDGLSNFENPLDNGDDTKLGNMKYEQSDKIDAFLSSPEDDLSKDDEKKSDSDEHFLDLEESLIINYDSQLKNIKQCATESVRVANKKSSKVEKDSAIKKHSIKSTSATKPNQADKTK